MITVKTFVLRPILFSFWTWMIGYIIISIIMSKFNIENLIFISCLIFILSIINTLFLLFLNIFRATKYDFLNIRLIIIESLILSMSFLTFSILDYNNVITLIGSFILTMIISLPLSKSNFIFPKKDKMVYQRFFNSPHNAALSKSFLIKSLILLLILLLIIICML